MKKIVIACDSYKECMDATLVAENIKVGFEKIYPNCDFKLYAIADGGEGTTKALVDSSNGTIYKHESVDALNRPITSFIGLSHEKDIAFIEIAASAGIELINANERNPLVADTRGVGMQIKAALKHNVKEIIIGIGGSATNDLGVGMLYELGMKFYDQNNSEFIPKPHTLNSVTAIDPSEMVDLANVSIKVACDVDNPLYGPNGATYVYGPQKGANKETIDVLEQNIIHFANILEKTYNVDPQTIIGGGAAGGLGCALNLCLNAQIMSGIEIISDLLNIEAEIAESDLVITGEGRMDGQSINGKGPIGIAKLAQKHHVPCIAICGSLGSDIELTYDFGITAAYSTMMQAENLDAAIKHTRQNLQLTAHSVARTIAVKFNN